MVKILTCIFLLMVLSVNIRAQDTIYKTNGGKASGKVIEINDFQVKYIPDSAETGYTCVIGKNYILKIVYASGKISEFGNLPGNEGIIIYKSDPLNTDFGRQYISLNLTDFIFRLISVSYEYTFKSGKLSLKVPFSFHYKLPAPSSYSSGGDISAYFLKRKVFSTGVELLFYPFGQGRTKVFIGPSMVYGNYKTWREIWDTTHYFQYEKNGNYYGLLIQNGILLQPSKHWNFSVAAGYGLVKRRSPMRENKLNFEIMFGLNAGYKW